MTISSQCWMLSSIGKNKNPRRGVHQSQPHISPKILLANLGPLEQTLLLGTHQDFRMIEIDKVQGPGNIISPQKGLKMYQLNYKTTTTKKKPKKKPNVFAEVGFLGKRPSMAEVAILSGTAQNDDSE